MADIAMLVAEEYERRVKNSRKSGSTCTVEDELFSGVSVLLAKRLDLDASNWIKNNKANLKEMMIPNPKSQIGLAAINGLFSA